MEDDYEASLSSPENDNELLDIQGQPEQEWSGEESEDNIRDFKIRDATAVKRDRK